ncbi:hypothetical protein [Flagellimonas meridianipacifica]|uniref:YD repeat-containing protein n=1 Tax=Flagellimonas meridianipacifica TaxID=1080225 RepID=A0A2T0M6Z7_9FLAO|nr:hypothetical protein [Allomuricauda pacifica]PRX53233.1 hypothetical protein CLV81_4142 [Allomuricauda pacifica]
MNQKIHFIVLLFAMFIFSSPSYSQKVARNKIPVSYVQKPLKPLGKGVKQYALKFTNTTGITNITQESISQSVQLEGFEYNQGAPTVIEVYLKGSKISVKPELDKSAGSPQQKYYRNVARVELDASVRFYDREEKVSFYKQSFTNNSDFVFQVSSKSLFTTEEQAKADLSNEKEKLEKELSSKLATDFPIYLNNYLNEQHGYVKLEQTFPVASMKSKSHDYAELDKIQSTYEDAIADYNKNGLTPGVQNIIEECINVWKTSAGQLDTKNKKAKINTKNVGAIYLNLALAYTWLEDFEQASTYLELSNASKGNAFWKSQSTKLIERLKKGHEQNQLLETGNLEIATSFEGKKSSNEASKTAANQTWRLKSKRKLTPSGRTNFNYSYSYSKDNLETYVSGSLTIKYVYDNSNNTISRHSVSRGGELKSANKTFVFNNGNPTNIVFRKNFIDYDITMTYSDKGSWLGFTNSKNDHALDITYENDMVSSAILIFPIIGAQKESYKKFEYTFNWNNNHLETANIKELPFNNSDENSGNSKGLTVEYSYNSANQITEIKGLPLFRYTFTYDENGNIAERIEHVGNDHFVYEWEKGESNTLPLLEDYFSIYKNPLVLPFSL